MAQHMTFKQLRIAFQRGILTASQVWEHVPDDITEAEAIMICGPRPTEG